MKRVTVFVPALLVGGLIAGAASAQIDAQIGASAEADTETGAAAEGEAETTAAAPEPAPAPEPEPATRAETNTGAQAGMGLPGQQVEVPGESDHLGVIGTFGVGYLGRQSMLIGAPLPATDPLTVTAPVIGVRYWLTPLIGIDGGLGFAATSGSIEATGAPEVSKVGPTVFILHAGVPLSLASSGHFSFQVVPELNVGFASATVEGVGGAPDNDLSGFHFDIGARAGAEVHFGFIGIPKLSLQGGVGVALQVDNTESEVDGASLSDKTTAIGTTLNGDPWDIFLGNISALYYF